MTTQGKGYLCLLLCLYWTCSFALVDKFRVVFEFKALDYEYPSPEARQADIDSGAFVYGKPIPIDSDIYFNPKTNKPTFFVSMPRFQPNTPATVGTIVSDKQGNPIIRPYPSWEWYKNPTSCNEYRILSTYRIAIDECDRLWIVDSGQTKIGNIICPPQILAFDLRTNRLIVKYEIPKDQYVNYSVFVTPIVDVLSQHNKCKNTFVYVADCRYQSILVYDHKNNNSWRVADKSMIRDPNFINYSILGSNFTSIDGVLGMALTPYKCDDSKRLYYHALSSDTEHYVKTSDLQNKALFVNNSSTDLDIFYTYTGRRGTQSAAEAIDKDGVMYFGLMSNVAFACFNTRGEYGIPGDYSDIVADNQETLQFISGVKVKRQPSGDQFVWIVSSRYNLVATNSMKLNDTNYRIQIANVNDLRRGTKCDPKRWRY